MLFPAARRSASLVGRDAGHLVFSGSIRAHHGDAAVPVGDEGPAGKGGFF
jgi:hypothetical protein